MKRFIYLALVCSVLLVSACSQSGITEDKVNDYVNNIETYILNKDIKSLLGTLSDDVLFHLDYTENGETKHYHMDKVQYEEWAKIWLEQTIDYDIHNISTVPGNSPQEAAIYFDIKITWEKDGEEGESLVHAKEVVKLVGDKIILVEYFSESGR